MAFREKCEADGRRLHHPAVRVVGSKQILLCVYSRAGTTIYIYGYTESTGEYLRILSGRNEAPIV